MTIPARPPLLSSARAGGLLLAILLAGTGSLGAQDATRIVGRAGQVYRNLTSLRAQFTQTISDRMIGDFDSKGTLVQAGNNHLLMQFSDPEGDRITLDGTHAWIYTPSSAPGQVIRVAIPSDPVYGANVVAWILDRPTERYQSTWLRVEAVAGRPADVVAMVPLSSSLPFTGVTVWLDQADALPRRIEIQETSGAKRTLVLSRIQTNTTVPAATFRFTPPSGVRIINQ
ncbi:MAG: outer membrane lipoprotein carrier protein LolA [Gemmatimonadota bacterium]|nr:outer membrane lipoprotein carrier protein LolA [Gemmatimonadota bacterium]